MKKSIFGKIGAAAVVLTLVTSSLVGGTFARYATEKSATATAAVAQWKVSFKKGDETSTTEVVDFALENENEAAPTAEGKIGPGSSGKIQFTVDGSNTEVGFNYEITADITNLNDIPLTFSKNADGTEAVEQNGKVITLDSSTIALDAATKKATGTIYWAWTDKGTSNSATEEANKNDTTLGTTVDKSGTIAIKLSASQITEVKTPAGE